MAIWREILFAMFMRWLVPAAAFAQERSYEWGWGMHPMGWMGGAWGIGMMFMMFFFWILIIAGLVIGIRWLMSETKNGAVILRWKFCASAMREAKLTGRNSKPRKEI